MSWIRIGQLMAQLGYADESDEQKRERKRAFADYLRANQTVGERMMARNLYHLGIDAEPQAQLRGWVVDFLDREHSVVFEVDGSSHDNKQEADEFRDAILTEAGYRVVRLTNDGVRNLMYSIAIARDAA